MKRTSSSPSNQYIEHLKSGIGNLKSGKWVLSKITIALFICTIQFSALAQGSISVNNTGASPDSTAILDLQSSSKGLLIPRMSTIQREGILGPATGLIVYDLDAHSLWCYAGSNWIEVMAGFTTLLRDTDADTRVEVEKAVDEDIIRFDVEGTERWTMIGSRLEPKNSGRSVFIGKNAGANDDLNARGNIAIGSGALEYNTVAPGIVAIGDSALNQNGNDSLLPYFADENSAIGSRALFSNTIGFKNTAIGYKALTSNKDGFRNTASGALALKSNIEGYENTANGYLALSANADGNRNAAIGSFAMWFNSSGSLNTAVGYKALYFNSDRSNLVAIGDSALFKNGLGATIPLHATKNTAVGSKSLYANTKGSSNTAMGYKTLFSNTTGGSNSAFGILALRENQTGHWNTGLGSFALQENVTAWGNTAVGFNAMAFNVGGKNNVAVGAWSLESNKSGSYNVGVGYTANRFNVFGERNTIIGYAAGNGGVEHSKSGNVFIGHKAGYNDTTDNKLYIDNSNTTLPLIYGDFTNGSELVGINGDLGVGTQSPNQRFHVSKDGADSVQTIVALLESSVSRRPLLLFSENTGNSIISGMSIEYNGAAGLGESNEMYINKVGGQSMVTFENSGKVGIATTAPSDFLHISAPSNASALRVQIGGATKLRVCQNGGISVGFNGGVPGPPYALQLANNSDIQFGSARAYSWVTYSDGRMKSEQAPLNYGMKEIMLLRPKSYLHHSSHRNEDGKLSRSNVGSKKDMGFIAQEVERIIPEIVYMPESDSDDLWSIDYIRLIPVLVHALQEQQATIEKLERRLGMIEPKQTH